MEFKPNTKFKSTIEISQIVKEINGREPLDPTSF